MTEHFDLRLQVYIDRLDFIIKKLEQESLRLTNIARFIKLVANGELKLGNRPMKEVDIELASLGFATDT